MEEQFSDRLSRLGPSDLDFYLKVVEAGSIRAGAAMTRSAINTVRRRMGRIEDLLGDIVAWRTPDGLKLTELGEQLLLIAREMKLTRDYVSAKYPGETSSQSIRLAVTEGLGTFWLMPRLVEFQTANPDIAIHLFCDMQRVDMAGGEYDIAVQLEKPLDPLVACERIGTLHLIPFAAESYLRKAGVPQSIDDWPNHRLVWQEADQVASHLLPYHLGVEIPEGLIGLRTNSSSAHFRAIATGGGIGMLPTYARAITRKVKPIDIGVRLKREIFCILNLRTGQNGNVQRTANWLKTIFSGEAYPWFHPSFIHPEDFEMTISHANVINLFEGYIDGL